MTSKANWVCLKCGQTFTRNTSGKRHNSTLHSNMSIIVEYTDYLAGLAIGKFKLPEASPKSFRRKKSLEVISSRSVIGNSNSLNSVDHNNNNLKNNYLYHNYHLNDLKSTDHFVPDKHFFVNNLVLIDSTIEKYENKLKGFLSKAQINELINQGIIIPACSYIETHEEFERCIRNFDKTVAYIKIAKRRSGFTPD